MNFTAKRLLFIFSIALNIGFIIMAVALFYNKHYHHHKDDKGHEMRLKILSNLDLPPDLEKSVAASMEEVEKIHSDYIRKLYQTRNDGLTLLSQPESLDIKKFKKLNAQIVDIMIRKNRLIYEHLIDIRNKLGDEKGARFFSEILKQVKKKDSKKSH